MRNGMKTLGNLVAMLQKQTYLVAFPSMGLFLSKVQAGITPAPLVLFMGITL